MAENESRKQGRQPGDIPRSVRQRTGSSSSSSEDEASAVDEAKDKAWHESKGVPYVPIGSPFEYAGISFLRRARAREVHAAGMFDGLLHARAPHAGWDCTRRNVWRSWQRSSSRSCVGRRGHNSHTFDLALCLGPAEIALLSSGQGNSPSRLQGLRSRVRADAPDDGVKFKAKSLEKYGRRAIDNRLSLACAIQNWQTRIICLLSDTKEKEKRRPAIWSYNAAEHHKRVHATSDAKPLPRAPPPRSGRFMPSRDK